MNLKSIEKTMQRKFKSFGGALALSWLALTPVWADDTEIFYATSDNEVLRPNLLFIIDTSGSMDDIVYEQAEDASGTPLFDGDGDPVMVSTGKDRLEHVQEAFISMLSTMSNVNVGLMRFSNPGGPILYPVSDLDSEAISDADTNVTARVGRDNDDAQEILSDGSMLVNEDHLNISVVRDGYNYFTDYVSGDRDDAEQDNRGNGDMTRYSSDLDFRGASYNSNSEQIIGVRFGGSDVPSNATVTTAYLEFTAEGGGNETDAHFLIYAEDDDTGEFGSNDGNISDRGLTSAAVPWTIEGRPVDGTKLVTPNIKDVVQEVLADSSWNAPSGEEDDMTFIIYPDQSKPTYGHKEIYSRDGADSFEDRPKLVIEYYTGASEPASEQSATGLVFRNLNIPRGVTITNAYIEFVATANADEAFEFEIVAEDNPAPSSYSSTAGDISGRSYTAETVSWTTGDAVAIGDTLETPDLAALVEAVTDQGTWCGGDDLAFKITGTEGLRQVHSHDGDPSLAPRLVVNYDPRSIPDGTSCYQGNVAQQTSSSSDDVEEYGTSVYLGGGTLDFDDGENVGIRFPDLALPQGATVSNAYIQLTQRSQNDSGSTTITISVEDSANAESYEAVDGTLDERTYGDSVAWNITDRWYEYSTYDSPNIADLVNDILAKNDWAPGNAMAFKLTTSGNDRKAYSFDSSPGRAPKLVVEYSADGSGQTIRTVRQELISVVNSLNHNGWTPVQDTLYEAAKYYRGEEVTWGARRGGTNGESGPHAYTRVSHQGSMIEGTYEIYYPEGCTESNLADSECKYQRIDSLGAGATYKSPITNECQSENHIFLLTDGFANRDHSTTLIKDMIGKSGSCDDDGTGDGGKCVQDLTEWMHNNDMSDDVENVFSDAEGNPLGQVITTHTIGFDFDDGGWLAGVAEKGGGKNTITSDAEGLIEFITGTVNLIQEKDNTFVAPVAAVNQFNRLNHLNNIYFAVYRPDETPAWAGNVKKYALGEGNIVLDADMDPNSPAVDPVTGFFAEDSVDLWDANPSDGLPGNTVEKGGAGSQMPARDSRNVYFHLTADGERTLTNSDNQVSLANISSGRLTKALFEAESLSDFDFNLLILWMRGFDLRDGATEDRYAFHDPLHSRPVAVTYNVSEDDPDVTIFVGTNGGSLQAIDASTGKELFAVYPEATLPIQLLLAENESTIEHPYGIDGHIVPWVYDYQADGINDSEDFVKLFFGMRRGGRNYYSMDVTDRSAPKMEWVIEGGTTPGFGELGQSWGTPIVGRVQVADEEPRDVLFISGGYDDRKDDETVRKEEDAMGRAVYIVDAHTGEKIWSASPAATSDSAYGYNQQFSDMRYSIPATLTVADVNGDRLDDLIIVGDTGGQVWRFDISNGKPFTEDVDNFGAGQFVSGAVIADLGVASGDNTAERNRRFYHGADVALVDVDGELELAVGIGSGFRAHPLNEQTHDRFFMLRQKTVFGPPAAYETITEDDLYDATDNRVADANAETDDPLGESEQSDEETALAAKEGWFIDLQADGTSGEKVLSTPLIFRNRVVFVTYQPNVDVAEDGDDQAVCNPRVGLSRVYYVDVSNGAPIKSWDDAGDPDGYCSESDCTEDDRAYELETESLIDEPVFICTDQGCDIFTGAEKPPVDRLTDNRVRKTYWRKDN